MYRLLGKKDPALFPAPFNINPIVKNLSKHAIALDKLIPTITCQTNSCNSLHCQNNTKNQHTVSAYTIEIEKKGKSISRESFILSPYQTARMPSIFRSCSIRRSRSILHSAWILAAEGAISSGSPYTSLSEARLASITASMERAPNL